jgi:RNA-directed DNA polymerase
MSREVHVRCCEQLGGRFPGLTRRILGFSDKSDAERVMKVLTKRFAKYGLTLHPEKTKLIDLNSRRGGSGRSFDFLGFTHYLGKSRSGIKVLKRKTSSKRLTRAIMNISKFIKLNRHMKLGYLIAAINIKLRGHYSYYGITFNYYSLSRFRVEVIRSLYKWLNRRGGKRKWNWSKFTLLVEQWYPLVKPFIYHSYESTKRN